MFTVYTHIVTQSYLYKLCDKEKKYNLKLAYKNGQMINIIYVTFNDCVPIKTERDDVGFFSSCVLNPL